MGLAEHLAFPLARLVRVMSPGDSGVMRRIVASVLDVIAHRIVETLDDSAIDRQAEDSRQEALRYAVGGIDVLGVAPLGDDVAMSKNDAIRLRAFLRKRPEHGAEGRDLSREVTRDLSLLGLGESNRLFQERGVEADFRRRFA